MDTRVNKRGHTEHFVRGQHLKLTDLKEKAQHWNQYLSKENIPSYPRPEFHVSHLRHDTNSSGIVGIASEMGFRAPDREEGPEDPEDPETLDLVWWSLSVGPEEIESAEQRLLEETYPDRTEEQAREQKRFLGKFTTSPAFLDTSRLGPYRVISPLQELLETYRTRCCAGSEPILRVYETVLYKQEVMHSVVVHSHFYNQLFQDYPLLTDSPDAVCAYEDGHFIWRPEAMCETHSFKLVQKPYQNQMVAHRLSKPKHQFYVWDNVAVAFHLPEGETLDFDMHTLRQCLRFCEPGHPTISPAEDFDSYEEANELVEAWWPYYPTPLY
ncbi:uncharacterized protein LOC144541783 [Centroberyx gerrardi]|uniref:uncharacterized protein n=1 Tax=Centroberyx gerrardi TaxID=166262 RepID=UPI003AB0694A